MMEKGPLYSNLKYNNFPYEQHSERNRQGEVIVKKFSNNILDNARREQIPP